MGPSASTSRTRLFSQLAKHSVVYATSRSTGPNEHLEPNGSARFRERRYGPDGIGISSACDLLWRPRFNAYPNPRSTPGVSCYFRTRRHATLLGTSRRLGFGIYGAPRSYLHLARIRHTPSDRADNGCLRALAFSMVGSRHDCHDCGPTANHPSAGWVCMGDVDCPSK
jgi:hypothetical protein